MIWLYSFLLTGVVCCISQIIYDNTKLTQGHITCFLVLVGVAANTFSIYENLIKYCGGGATVLITNFGYVLGKFAIEGVNEGGFFGLLKNLLVPASASITIVVIVAFLSALLFKPKS